MELRDRILEEATKEFFSYGIRSVRMDDIAFSLGISKRTVYETFKDKNELVRSCLESLSALQDARNRKVLATSENVIAAIFTFMQEGLKAMNSINPVFFYDLKKIYPEIWNKVQNENKTKGYSLTHKMLRKGVNEGLFRKDINISIVSKLFHEQMNVLADEKIFPRDEFDHPELFRNLVINFTRGISTNKGINIIDKLLA